MKKLPPILHATAFFFACSIITQGASAATLNWTGASGTDLLWATPGNWNPSGPPGVTDGALFIDNGATNDTGAAVADNILAADLTIQSLAYSQTNGFHNTVINSGVTLTVCTVVEKFSGLRSTAGGGGGAGLASIGASRGGRA